jgi:1-pyrroline-5-carboxylate dehydrogenase
MNNSIVNVPNPVNEPIKEYKPGSPEKESVLGTYKRLKDSKTDVKMWIGGKFIESSQTSNMSPPHDQL